MTTMPTRAHRSNVSKFGSAARTHETMAKIMAGVTWVHSRVVSAAEGEEPEQSWRTKKEVNWVAMCSFQSRARL